MIQFWNCGNAPKAILVLMTVVVAMCICCGDVGVDHYVMALCLAELAMQSQMAEASQMGRTPAHM